MATMTPKQLFQAQLASGTVQVYTSSSGMTSLMHLLTICNVDTVDRMFSLYIVPSGGSPSDANRIYKEQVIPAGESFLDPPAGLAPRTIQNGATIHISADFANKLTVTGDGAEITA